MLAEHSELKQLIKVTPGIRPKWYSTEDDQTRIDTPTAVVNLGSNYLVIGRPITKAEDPSQAAQLLAEELKQA